MEEINGNKWEDDTTQEYDSHTRAYNGVIKYLLNRGVKLKDDLITDYSKEIYNVTPPDIHLVCDEIQQDFKAFGRWVNDNKTKYV